MKVTITDIARKTGLSVSTISKYLNHKPVLPENRKKIEEAIQKLDFTPNRMAQNLRSKNTRTIALVLPPLDHSLYGNLVNPVENQLKSMNYLSFVCTNRPEDSSERFLLEYLFNNHITGILCVGNSLSEAALIKIQQKKIPCVCLDNRPGSFTGDTICASHYEDGRQAASLLLRHGHQQIAVLGSAHNPYASKIRRLGIQDEYKNNCKNINSSISFHTISNIPEVPLVLHRLLSASAPPSGILCADYLSSLGLLSAIVNNRLQIPRDFSLFCFDYERLFEALVPHLCSMNEDYDALGRQGAALLLERIQSPEKPTRHVLLPSAFYPGNTISAPGQKI